MNIRNKILPASLLASLFFSTVVFADGDHPMTDGVIRKINAATGKITIKHGPIDNLDMPPMSMVFGVQDPTMLQGLNKGDNVKFYVVDKDGKMIIEEIEIVK